jgi:FMN phosphatase YigB (HAD superfamily)
MNAIRVVSVDVDGTLYRIRRIRSLWRMRGHRDLLRTFLWAYERLRVEGPFPDGASLKARGYALVAEHAGVSVDEARLRLDEVLRIVPGVLTRGARPYPSVREALLRAHRAGLRLVAFSEHDPERKIHRLGLGDLPWSLMLSAAEEGALKPHARSFLRITERLHVSPSEVLHMGDQERLDVAGALAAGMRAWLFSPAEPDVATAAERIVVGWDPDLFESLALQPSEKT